ncbi:GNAT family N-acetyltransferase [Streptomyces globisporus]|uniref:GNAT family N-acetyltransferase n=1 Tax=Streptomyces globisporus TaxID=1908 RepID=UPI0036399171
MIIRAANTSDVAALMDLRVEAEQWLDEAGIDQWRNPQTRAPALAKWRTDIAAGRTWMVQEGDAILATITLAPPDRDFWRNSDRPEDAVYVAKLITSRAAKGQRLGGQLLDWAGHKAQERGKAWVRLDCWRSNVALQDFYVGEGFEHVRTEAPAHRLSGWLGQRAATVARHPDSALLKDASQ